MRWLKFTADGKTSWGVVEGDRVVAVDGDPFSDHKRIARSHALNDVKIELPLVPRTFYCVGLNYLKHLKEAADRRGEVPAVPDRPEVGYRAQNALIAHDEDVVIPASATEKIHYEGELVVVIGKTAKHLTPANAMDCVFGYTIGNDVSERTWQKADRGLWRSKNADTFKPMGPWIETSADLASMETIIRVNGKETYRFRTNDMIFGVVSFLVEMSKYFTLWPGDVVWMGTTAPRLISSTATSSRSRSPESGSCATGSCEKKHRVGKGALAPCPPSRRRQSCSRIVGALGLAHLTILPLHRRGQRLGDRPHWRLVLGGNEILELHGPEFLAFTIGDLDLPAFAGPDPRVGEHDVGTASLAGEDLVVAFCDHFVRQGRSLSRWWRKTRDLGRTTWPQFGHGVTIRRRPTATKLTQLGEQVVRMPYLRPDRVARDHVAIERCA